MAYTYIIVYIDTCTNVLEIFSALALVTMTMNINHYVLATCMGRGAEIMAVCGYKKKCIINEVTNDSAFVD